MIKEFLTERYRRLMLPFASAMLIAALSLPVLAQTSSAGDDDKKPAEEYEEQVMELVRVTGYHVRRIDAQGPAPVVTFDGVQLEQAGINTLEEATRYLPINFPSNYTNFGTIGDASFNLRGLGTEATLTLINGLRIAPYAQAEEPFVDINAIPVSAIERIEILKDGASAIYGADAVAGVVNVILKNNYDGIEATVGYGISEHSDAEESRADILMGNSFEAGNVLFSLSYYQRDPVFERDRDWYSDADYSQLGGPNYRSPRSSPPTLLRYDTFTWDPDPACGTDPLLSNIAESPWGPDFGAACRFNYRQFGGLVPGYERWGATLSGRYEFDSGVSFFGDFFWSDFEAETNQAPSPVQGSPIVPTVTGAPYVMADHPDNPFGVDGELLFRPLDLGNRVYISHSQSYRLVVGLEGDWRKWNWRASLLSSENDVDKDYLDMVRQTRLQQALLGQGGDSGNLWYNPFGFEPQNSQEIKEWLTVDALSTNTSGEHSADVLFDRFFGELPGGPIGAAVGLQYREQELEQWADENLRSGDLAGGSSELPVSADREIFSAYAEFSLPLTETLEAQLALRYEHYSDFGSTTNPKIALRWQPADWIMLRGSWSTSFLAPSFTQLYAPRLDYLDWAQDKLRCDYTGLPEDCGWREYPAVFQGNPDLEPEEGESWFAGFMWAPSFLPGFELQLDFWKFVHENRIVGYGGQWALIAGDDFGIHRAPTEPDGTPGRIESIMATFVNREEFRTSGFDTTLLYNWQTESAGDFQASLMHTYVDEYQWTDSIYGDSGVDYAGKFVGFPENSPIPKNRFNLNLNWSLASHNASANIHYMGEFEYDEGLWEDGEETDQPWIISDQTTLALQYSYTFKRLRNARLQLGCTNCTGETPPQIWGYNVPYIDLRGRMYYFRWTQPFR